MNAFVQGAVYHGPENRQPLLYHTPTGIAIRVGFIYVDAMGWPRVEVDRWFLA